MRTLTQGRLESRMKADDPILVRLSALEDEVAAMKATIAPPAKVPGAKVTAPAAARQPEGVRIMNVVERCPIAIPTEAEYRKICAVVFRAYPKIRPDWSDARRAGEDEAEFYREFAAAFEWVSRLKRTDAIDKKHGLSWWTDAAGNFYLHAGRSTDIRAPAFLAAVIGAGDVDFTPGDQFGNSWSFGLSTYSGRLATEAWRVVLEGKLRVPVAGPFGAATLHRPGVRIASEG